MNDILYVLQQASPSDQANLAAILNLTEATPDALIDGLQWQAQHTAYYYLGYRQSYDAIVRQVADQLQITYSITTSVEEIETSIVQTAFHQMWEAATPEQREVLQKAWTKVAQEYDKLGTLAVSSGLFASLAAAKLSGFGIYLAATTLVGGLTSALGVTLPFVVYTSMTSAIAVIIGPAGWIGTGIVALWRLNGVNHTRLLSAICYICMLRSQQNLSE